jgi:hypothetical protein
MWKIIIKKNDRNQTHVWTLRGFSKTLAEQTARDLNGAFASEGVAWFAAAEAESE